MKRTQLYLDEEMARTLAAESRRRGTTVSELVREAVATAYGRGTRTDRRAVIHRLAGVWADRDDLADPDAFVRGLREERAQPSTGPTRAKVSARHRRHH
jgi:ribbon-helix-helix CopG family protein